MIWREWAFVAVLYGMLLVPCLLAAVAVAWSGRWLVRDATARSTRTVQIFCAVAIPALMIGRGLYIGWPWPWWEPTGRPDGFPPGPLLVSGAALLLPISGAVSWRLVRPRFGR